MKTFEPYGWIHLVAVVAAIAAWIWVVRRARRLDGEAEQAFRRHLAWFIIISNGIVQAYRLLPSAWNLDASLPLHLCDFAWMASIWALWNKSRLPMTLVYYWGFGLSWQAFLTPTVDEGPAHIYFWAFFFLHWQIVATALLIVGAFSYAPRWGDFWRCVGVTFVLYVSVFGLNVWLKTPYFFNAEGDGVSGTPIALLGDWPIRVVWLGMLVFILFALMTWPWTWRRRRVDA